MDLLEHLADMDAPTSGPVHILMPNMGHPCGVDLLTASRAAKYRTWTFLNSETYPPTCPECLSSGYDAERGHAMQKRQAVARG